MIDLNTILIVSLGGLGSANAYWLKHWKDSTEGSLDKLHTEVDDINIRLARMEGRLNGKVF